MLYKDYGSSFEVLLTSSGSICIHAKTLQRLMIDTYKSRYHLSPSLVWEFHEKKCIEYNLRTKPAGSAANLIICIRYFVYSNLFFCIVNSWFKSVLSFYCKYQL